MVYAPSILSDLDAIYLIFKRFLKTARRNYSFMSVRPAAWCNLAPAGRIFIKFNIIVGCLLNSLEKF
jgi:hypothetical protein